MPYSRTGPVASSTTNYYWQGAPLVSGVSAGATTIAVASVPPPSIAIGNFVAVSPLSINCEIRRVTNISGGTLTLNAALNNSHSSNDQVWVCPTDIPLSWYGAQGGAGSSYDNEPALQAAFD